LVESICGRYINEILVVVLLFWVILVVEVGWLEFFDFICRFKSSNVITEPFIFCYLSLNLLFLRRKVFLVIILKFRLELGLNGVEMLRVK